MSEAPYSSMPAEEAAAEPSGTEMDRPVRTDEGNSPSPARPSIRVADTAGFCYGVNRAVETVYRLLGEGKRVVTLGPIIHNNQVVEDLANRGVVIVETVDQAPENATLVIRSHGVDQATVDRLNERGVNYIDATCPFVRKIHTIVSAASREGDAVLIAGDRNHPEVRGIRGHCGPKAYVFGNQEELAELLKMDEIFSKTQITAVSQTTFHEGLWKKCAQTIKKVYTNATIFDTICNATSQRQQEAEALARSCDLMLVIGGRQSSNTAKLRDVCAQYCQTCLIETAAELPAEPVLAAKRIGITAGASTPAGIIKEVQKTMSEMLDNVSTPEEIKSVAAANEEVNTEPVAAEPPAQVVEEAAKSFDEMTYEEALEASLNNMNTDQKVKGVVLAITPTEIQVDIGRKHAGYVPVDEFSYDPAVNSHVADHVQVGDIMDLIVMRTNDQEGTVMLSKRRFDASHNWEDICTASESGEVLEGRITDVIKGGLLAMVKGVRVFVPASQATLYRTESLDDMKGQTVSLRIIEVNRGRKRAVGSIRSVLREQRHEQEEAFWGKVAVGDTYTGTVKSLTSYGAFVDLGGVDGMVHISELSWRRIKHPSEVVKVGDVIEVYVKGIDTEKKKVSLGYKKAEENPWAIFLRDFHEGDVIKARIVSMTTYGAFANIIEGVDGLIHISQIANTRIAKPQDVLEVGQEIDAKIIGIDTEKKRISLSIRALLEDAPEADADAQDEIVAESAPEAVESAAEQE